MTAAAVLYVTDLGRMAAFYQRCFGMSQAEAGDGDFVVLASADWDLSLVRLPAAAAAAVAVTDPPARRSGSPVKLAFEVASLGELRPVLAAAGGQPGPVESAWDFRGRRHLDCLDPEGNVLQLRQRLAPQ
jgi:predicted enzyme related to lactoylglutathione lyase